ncbi:hypothetical protein RSOL_242470, partial [Rhizoctonia solani AG-3 Rhs1AP]
MRERVSARVGRDVIDLLEPSTHALDVLFNIFAVRHPVTEEFPSPRQLMHLTVYDFDPGEVLRIVIANIQVRFNFRAVYVAIQIKIKAEFGANYWRRQHSYRSYQT